MEALGLKPILDADPRPTLVIDTLVPPERASHLQPVYVNAALRSSKTVPGLLVGQEVDHIRLRTWMNTTNSLRSGRQEDHLHKGPDHTLWFAYMLADRWRVVQHYQINPMPLPFDIVTPPADGQERHVALMEEVTISEPTTLTELFDLSAGALGEFDGLAAHVDVISNVDWSATALGAVSGWPADLLQLVHLILLEPSPQVLFLGPENLLLYNVGYAKFAGERHPAIMGQPLFSAWKEAVELNIASLSFIDETGRPFVMNDFNISLNRHGYLEELYMRWTTIPLKGQIRGYLCTASEETARKVGERRKAFLFKVSAACRGIRDLTTFWRTVLDTLGTNGRDFPFAFLYSKDQGNDNHYMLEGVLDAVEACEILPQHVDLSSNTECFVSVLQQAQDSTDTIPISTANGTLPNQIADLSISRGSGDRCQEGLVCAVRRATDNRILGLLVIGLNTRKTFDADDQAFVGYMTRALSDLATNTINAQEADRSAHQAATRHQILIKALATTTSEANHFSAKWQSLVKTMEMVDVGVFEFDLTGKLVQANDAFFRMSGHPQDPDAAPKTWEDLVHPEDLEICQTNWNRALAGERCNSEIRYKFNDRHPSTGRDGLDGFWVSTIVVPVTDPVTGNITSISGCVTNVMPQKRQQRDAMVRADTAEKLRASEERLHRFAEHALCPIMIYDADRKLQFCNNAYCELMGYEKGDPGIWQTDWSKLVMEEDAPEVLEKWMETMETKKPLQLNCRLNKPWTAPDGTVGPTCIVAASYPELDKDDNITGWVAVAFDISQLKWAETVQQKRFEEAMEAKRQQENFIDMTSHEIRNPLGAVVHCADSLLASLVDLETLVKDSTADISSQSRKQLLGIYDSSFDAVNTIISCSTHQRRIVDDILTWSKLNSKLLKITPSIIRPVAILQDVRNMFELDAAKVGVALTVHQAADMDSCGAEWVMLDTGRLMQVLINLITNAIKFTREENTRSRTVTITMGTTLAKPSLDRLPLDFVPGNPDTPSLPEAEWGSGAIVHVHFVVEDTGCGLSDEEKSKIFARFSQGSPRTHTKYGGSGLGLYISRELVEIQGGEIGFASQSGVGSKFGFFIRGRVASAPAAVRTAGSGRAGGAETVVPRAGRMSSTGMQGGSRRFCILVVEDNVVNQAVLSKQLRKLGHEVHTASNGVEALEWLRTCSAWKAQQADTPVEEAFGEGGNGSAAVPELSVILMDVEMPVMDGLSCAAEIRALQARGSIVGSVPIIAVSANARTEQVGEALQCGMDDAISKPFRICDLMPKIERLAA